MTCLYCFKRSISFNRKLASFLGLFNPFYRFTPIIAGIFGLMVVLIVPPHFQAVILLLSEASMAILCLLGLGPFVFPLISKKFWREVQKNYQLQLENYDLTSPSFCTHHPEIMALFRCQWCFQPFCATDLISDRFANSCHECFEKSTQVQMSPILYTPLTVGIVALIGVVSELLTFGTISHIGFVNFFIATIIICGIIYIIAFYIQKRAPIKSM